jgi:hypothetical protein
VRLDQDLTDNNSPSPADDPVIAALVEVEDAVRHAAELATVILERAEHIRARRSAGLPYRDIVPNEQRPLIVELLTANLESLSTAGNRLRRMESRALYEEGLTMGEIAILFGVSRQRIAALLRAP